MKALRRILNVRSIRMNTPGNVDSIVVFFVIMGLSVSLGGMLAAQEVTLTMAYAGGDPLSKALIHDSVMAFTRANPGISIEEHASPVGTSYLDFIQVLDAAGEFPDVVEMRDTPLFYRAGKIAPLPDEVAGLVVDPVTFGGQVYTLSLFAQGPLGMMYNAKFFRDNNLAEPKTYAEFLGLLDTIKGMNVIPITVGGKDLWHIGFTLSKYYFDEVTAQNPNFIADRYAGKVRFTDASMKQALTKWADLFSPRHGWVDPDFISVTDARTVSVLVSGKAVMLYSGTWMLQQIMDADPDFEIGWFPVPSSADDRINLIGGSTAQGWAMSAEAARNPARARAILDFMTFFFRKDNYQPFISTMNVIPSTVEKMTHRSAIPVMEKILDIYANTHHKQLFWNQKVGENELPPNFRDIMNRLGMELLLGVKDVDEVTRALDAEWDIVT